MLLSSDTGGSMYHQATLDMLGRSSMAIPSAPPVVFTPLIGLNIPESVREWYSHHDGATILSTYSNDDHALLPASLERHEYQGMTIMEFLVENQGCCSWGFLLDGSDDPLVVVNPDMMSPPMWHYCAEHFSTFVYTRAFDFQFLIQASHEEDAADDDWYLDGPPFNAQAQAWLEQEFQLEPATREAAYYLRRYSRNEKRERVVIFETRTGTQWGLTAATPEARRRLVAEVAARL